MEEQPVQNVSGISNTATELKSRTYNNQFKGSGRNIYLFFIFFSIVMFVLAPLCWLFIGLMLRRKLVVGPDGITIHYAFHKMHLGWNEIAGFGYDERDFMNAPIAFGVDGKKHRISMAFKLCPQKIGWRTNYIVDPADNLNRTILTELQGAQATYGGARTNNFAENQQGVPPAFTAVDLGHVMQGGKMTQSDISDIVYEWHTSKIVKFGGTILYLFWTGVIAGVYHVAGLIAWVALTVAIFASYQWYKRTKSDLAWNILQSLVGIILLVIIGFAIAGHYYVP